MSSRRYKQQATTDSAEEEEKLFGTYISENKPTFERRVVYIVNALILSIAPVYLYYSIFNLSLKSYGIVFLLVSAASAFGIQLAYHNVAFSLNSRLLREREGAVSRSKTTGRGVEAQKVMQKNATNQEAVAFSILYNNSIFLFSLILLAFYLFPNLSAVYNYVISVGLSASLVAVLSQPTKSQ